MVERSEISDQELINGVVNSNKESKRALFDRYFPQVFDYAARVNRDIVRAEQIIALAFERIFEEIYAGREVEEFRTQIFQAVYAITRDGMASKEGRDLISTEFNLEPEFLQADPQKISQPSLLLHDSEIVELTWWVASNIEPAQYSALDLKYRQAFTSNEIAAVLGIRIREVDVLLDRAIEFLNQNLLTILIIGRDSGMDAGLQALTKGEKPDGPYYIPSLKVRNYVMGSDAYRKIISKYPIALEVFAALSNARPPFGSKLKIVNYLLNSHAEVSADNVNSGVDGEGVHTEDATSNDFDNTPRSSINLGFIGRQRLLWILGIISMIGLVTLIMILGNESGSPDSIAGDISVVGDPVVPLEQSAYNLDLVEFKDVNLSSSSHVIGDPSEVMRITISWEYIDDTEGNVADYVQNKIKGYSMFWDSSPDSMPDRIVDIEQTVSEVISPTLSFGQWWFHITSMDVDGNWSKPVHSGPYVLEKLMSPTVELIEESTRVRPDSGVDPDPYESISIVSAPLVPGTASIELAAGMTSKITDQVEDSDVSNSKHQTVAMPKADYEKPSGKVEQTVIESEFPSNKKMKDDGGDLNEISSEISDERTETIDTETSVVEPYEENVVEANAELAMSDSGSETKPLGDQSTSDVNLQLEENLQNVLDKIVPIEASGRSIGMLPPIPNFFSGTVQMNEFIESEGNKIIATMGDYGSNPVELEDGSYKLLMIDPLSNDFYGEEITFWIISGDKIFKSENHAVFQEGNLSKGSNSIFRNLNLEF